MQSKNKQFLVIIAAVLLFLTLSGAWMAVGRPMPKTISNVGDGSHHFYMTPQQNVDWMKRALPPDEYQIWRDNWDLQYKDAAWKEEHIDEVKEIQRKYVEQDKKQKKMLREDPDAYQKKYPEFFGKSDRQVGADE